MSYVSTILADNPVEFWELQETSGTVAASAGSGASNGGYNGGFVLNQAGPAAGTRSVALDGTGYVDCGQLSREIDATANGITLEAWVFPTAYNVAENVSNFIGRGFDGSTEPWCLRMGDGSSDPAIVVTGAFGDSSGEADGPDLGLNTWYHVVGKFDISDSSFTAYVNGVQQDSETGASIFENAEEILIGALNLTGTPAQFFIGRIAYVAIYGSALSGTRVLAHYNAMSPAAARPRRQRAVSLGVGIGM